MCHQCQRVAPEVLGLALPELRTFELLLGEPLSSRPQKQAAPISRTSSWASRMDWQARARRTSVLGAESRLASRKMSAKLF